MHRDRTLLVDRILRAGRVPHEASTALRERLETFDDDRLAIMLHTIETLGTRPAAAA